MMLGDRAPIPPGGLLPKAGRSGGHAPPHSLGAPRLERAGVPAAAWRDRLLENVRIVLVRPREGGNIGAAARAMKNFGLRDLVLVDPAQRRPDREAAMAVHACDLVEHARTVPTLSAAVADCVLVVGTTCRGGLYRAPAAPLDELASLMVKQAGQGRVAAVFGPENHGLSNADLRSCQRLAKIETNAGYLSINLAQSVLLMCYELHRSAGSAPDAAAGAPVPALAGRVEFLLQSLQAAFLRIGFLNPQNPDHIMFALRRLFGRAVLEDHDVSILLGLARQIEWYERVGCRAERSLGAPDQCTVGADGDPVHPAVGG